ncbi:hypothetical protein GGQ74_001217 [Desulfobaculum xiamenense]|uniref:Uncharacterized protein n=1 Tax=Desulfobaculum xiamenense TaxID=995050 RepID=A0A846QKB4_9BACT|nr:hypothetical protein [Desulfobaculum xiamenense]NJB67577.1 hypothetical protein [Desulfobaculum xiamenense]
MIIYAVAIFLVLLLAWHFFLHGLLTDAVHPRLIRTPFAVRVLSLVCFIVALIIVWTLAGISVLTYLAAVLGYGGE